MKTAGYPIGKLWKSIQNAAAPVKKYLITKQHVFVEKSYCAISIANVKFFYEFQKGRNRNDEKFSQPTGPHPNSPGG